jgi:hypothetical protein
LVSNALEHGASLGFFYYVFEVYCYSRREDHCVEASKKEGILPKSLFSTYAFLYFAMMHIHGCERFVQIMVINY